MIEPFFVNLLILVTCFIILGKSSEIAVSYSVKVADITGFGKTTIGFMVVAFATSLPELLIAVFAVLGGGAVGISVGNVLGANITNICLILGLCILISNWKRFEDPCLAPIVAKEESGSLRFGLFMASLIPLVLLYLKEASRYVGVVLLTIFVLNTYNLSREKRMMIKEEGSTSGKSKLLRYLFLTLLGIFGVVSSAYFLVGSATYIAEALGVPHIIIGATIVSLGTTLPELVTSIQATRLGHLNLALGNIIGSAFVNLTCILGFTLTFSDYKVDIIAFSDVAIFSLIANLLLWYFISGDRLCKREGFILLAIYAIFRTISLGSLSI
ncbi:MAG: sodium:calcium antiporter [Nitrososphaeria archaeon]|nr:sodium:calcium antiporter [Nitrososphaeria archaeon]